MLSRQRLIIANIRSFSWFPSSSLGTLSWKLQLPVFYFPRHQYDHACLCGLSASVLVVGKFEPLASKDAGRMPALPGDDIFSGAQVPGGNQQGKTGAKKCESSQVNNIGRSCGGKNIRRRKAYPSIHFSRSGGVIIRPDRGCHSHWSINSIPP